MIAIEAVHIPVLLRHLEIGRRHDRGSKPGGTVAIGVDGWRRLLICSAALKEAANLLEHQFLRHDGNKIEPRP
jgi:hypothetical protein